jgi:hypothetical protein
MRITAVAIVLVCALAAATPLSAQDNEPSAIGLWQQVDRNGQTQGWFLIGERNGIYHGRIAKMFPRDGDPPNPVCSRCEGEQQNAPWLGLTIINGMRRDGMNYEDGRILDPRNGNVYRARMTLSPDGQTLTVRGYLGHPALGQDQTWRRLPESAMAQIDGAARPPRTQGSGPSRR